MHGYLRNLRTGIVLACCVSLASCAYTVERKWVPGHGPRTHGDAMAGFATAADFPAALRSCVAKYDPDRLQDLDAGHEYRISGWFVSSKTGPVVGCMEEKGWLAMPTTLFAP